MSAQDRHQYHFADGLRGIAAIQVVLAHYAAVFLPLFGHSTPVQHFAFEKWLGTSPFFFLIDGGTAVTVFFVISGFVLSRSFSRSNAPFVASVAKRVVRLFIPVAIACLMAWALLLVAPNMREALRESTGTGVMGNGHEIVISIGRFAREFFLGSMFLGFKGVSLFDSLGWLGLAPSVTSVNPPFWTLHVELWGSLLVLSLCALRKLIRVWSFGIALVFVVWWVGLSFYLLFVAGFVLEWIVRNRKLPSSMVLACIGLCLIAWGEYVGVTKGDAYVYRFFLSVSDKVYGHAYNPYTFESTVAGIAIFGGILLCFPVRQMLSSRWAQFLGRLSFGMYLFHFPILVAVGGLAFFASSATGYGVAIVIALAAGCVISGLCAWLFDEYVDPWVLGLAKRTSNAVSLALARRTFDAKKPKAATS